MLPNLQFVGHEQSDKVDLLQQFSLLIFLIENEWVRRQWVRKEYLNV